MQKMVAKVKFDYRGVTLEVGDGFDADDEHVPVLTLIGHARVELGIGGGEGYATRAMTSRLNGAKRQKAS